jgi:hypothetical protein
MNPVYDMFNDIANRMRMTEGGEEYISNCVTFKGATGQDHELSLNQAQLLLGILDGNHPFLTSYNPLEFLIFSYQFQDKIKMKYLSTSYQIIYDAEEDTIFISGIMRHPMTVEGHPDYVPGSTVPIETFQTTIDNVGLYGSLALVNCIAAQDPKFAPIKGSFGGSFIYELKDGKQSISKYVPSALEEIIPEEEIQEAIGNAVKKLTPQNFNPLPKTVLNGIKDTSNTPIVEEPQKMDLRLNSPDIASHMSIPNPYGDISWSPSGTVHL